MDKPKVEIIDMEVKYKSRWDKFKHKTWEKKEKFKNWVRDYPQEAAALFGMACVGAKKIYNGVKAIRDLKPSQAELDREWHDTHVYDRSLGMYFPLKRKMTPRECMEFERRRQKGETTGHILESMRLLKY